MGILGKAWSWVSKTIGDISKDGIKGFAMKGVEKALDWIDKLDIAPLKIITKTARGAISDFRKGVPLKEIGINALGNVLGQGL